MSVSIFRAHPVTHLLRILIFQPAIRINNLNAVNRFFHVVLPCDGRRRCLCKDGSSAEHDQASSNQKIDPCQKTSLPAIHIHPSILFGLYSRPQGQELSSFPPVQRLSE